MKRFLIKIALFMVILAALVLGLNRLYVYMDHSDIDGTKKFRSVPEEIRVCNTGSSHAFYGFCYDRATPGTITFNFALVSQSLSYDGRILEHYQDRLAQGAVVIIPVSYHSLYGKEENTENGFRSKNQRYYKFLPENLIMDYDQKTAALQKVPILTAYENTAFVFLGIEDNDIERWEQQTADDIDLQKDVQAAYRRHIAKADENGYRATNKTNMDSLHAMIALCKEIGAKPVLITTPFLREYTDEIRINSPTFFDTFAKTLERVSQEKGVTYCDYSHDERFIDDHSLFMNGDHLNKTGALYFTDILFEEVIDPLIS